MRLGSRGDYKLVLARHNCTKVKLAVGCNVSRYGRTSAVIPRTGSPVLSPRCFGVAPVGPPFRLMRSSGT